MSLTSPAIILVNTQLPENIGACARGMMNFGLTDLRLIVPRETWPNTRAYDLAAHAASILDKAVLFNTTQEAVADIQRVYAATARPREMVKPVLSPQEATKQMHEENLPSAILFGPERTGLTNDDLALADAIITIPTAAALASLNVAQSVVVIAYQFFAQQKQINSPLTPKSPLATKQELQGFFDHLERELDAIDFWKVADKKQKMWLNLRNIFSRAHLSEQEVRSLHGVVAELRKSTP